MVSEYITPTGNCHWTASVWPVQPELENLVLESCVRPDFPSVSETSTTRFPFNHCLDVVIRLNGKPPLSSSKDAEAVSAEVGFVMLIVPELELLLVSQSPGTTFAAVT